MRLEDIVAIVDAYINTAATLHNLENSTRNTTVNFETEREKMALAIRCDFMLSSMVHSSADLGFSAPILKKLQNKLIEFCTKEQSITDHFTTLIQPIINSSPEITAKDIGIFLSSCELTHEQLEMLFNNIDVRVHTHQIVSYVLANTASGISESEFVFYASRTSPAIIKRNMTLTQYSHMVKMLMQDNPYLPVIEDVWDTLSPHNETHADIATVLLGQLLAHRPVIEKMTDLDYDPT